VLFSLAFVCTNRVIYLGFLINLFFSACVYISCRRIVGVRAEHGQTQIKSKQHRLSSVLRVLSTAP
jgi:hypothetical protein